MKSPDTSRCRGLTEPSFLRKSFRQCRGLPLLHRGIARPRQSPFEIYLSCSDVLGHVSREHGRVGLMTEYHQDGIRRVLTQ